MTAVTTWGQTELVHHCSTCGSGGHGRLLIAGGGPPVSLARSGALAVIAVGQQRAIGIDIESRGSVTVAEVRAAGVALAPDEDPTRAWVRAEAAGKALGVGLAPIPKGAAVQVKDLALSPELTAAIAIRGPADFAVEVCVS